MNAANPSTDSTTDSNTTAPELTIHEHGLRELWRLFRPNLVPHRWRLIWGCSFIAISGGVYGLMPLFAKALFDMAIPEGSIALAAMIGGAFIVTHALRLSLWYLAMRQILLIQEKLTFALRTQGFRRLQNLSLRFHGQFPSGYLYQAIFGNAIQSFAGCMQTVFKQLSLYITALLISLISCFMLNWVMTLVVLVGSMGYVAISRFLSPRIYKRTRESVNAQNDIADYIVDRLRGTHTIQSLAIEDHVQNEFETRLWPAQMKSLAVAKQTFQLNICSESMGYIVTAMIMIFGAWATFDLGLTTGELVAFLAYQATFINIVSTLTNVWGSFASARAGMDQFYSLMYVPDDLVNEQATENPAELETEKLTPLPTPTHAPPHAPPHPTPHAPTRTHMPIPMPLRGDLQFHDVGFSYDDQQNVINHLNLTVPAGQTVALVGASGSGKTTVANLLMRFITPTSGRITLDNIDTRSLPLRDYRTLFGVVLQDPYLFNESIRTNLLYARADATEQDMIDALEQAQAWSFVSQLPGGLDYPVRDGGQGLSGGQRQRLAIARCLLLCSRFVILDEPTSALDLESEYHVQRALDILFQQCTVFVIAHRLSTIRRADRILVLDHGRVVQDGNYDQLATQPGHFQNLHNLSNYQTTP